MEFCQVEAEIVRVVPATAARGAAVLFTSGAEKIWRPHGWSATATEEDLAKFLV